VFTRRFLLVKFAISSQLSQPTKSGEVVQHILPAEKSPSSISHWPWVVLIQGTVSKSVQQLPRLWEVQRTSSGSVTAKHLKLIHDRSIIGVIDLVGWFSNSTELLEILTITSFSSTAKQNSLFVS
jgi:hypothetical protein